MSKIVVILIIVSNNKVLGIFHHRTPATDAFLVAHVILSQIIVVLLELSMLTFMMSKPSHKMRTLF